MDFTVMLFYFVLINCLIETVDSTQCFDMTPKDPVIRRGQDLWITCSLKTGVTDSDCDNYIINNTSIQKASGQVSPEFLRDDVSKTTVTATIRNATFDDAGPYLCVHGDTETIQRMIIVSVGEAPGLPENLTCSSKNFGDLSCFFQPSTEDVNIPTNWSMEFKQNSHNWTKFPESNCDRTVYKCRLSLLAKPPEPAFLKSARYQVRVVVWNRLGNATTNVTIEHVSSIVKPNPVEQLEYQFINGARNVTLRWMCPKALRFRTTTMMLLDYTIIIKSAWDNRTIPLQNRKVSEEALLVENLVPYADYSVSVQAKPSDARLDIYWSDLKTITFVTPNAISRYAVTMATGSYMSWNCGQEEMCLLVYWKNPERQYWYGPLTGYRLTLTEVDSCNGQSYVHILNKEPECRDFPAQNTSEDITGMTVYGMLVSKVLPHQNYAVQIRLRNDAGLSKNYSEITIPRSETGQTVKLSWVAVEMMDARVFYSWRMISQYCSTVTSVTYYWCLEDVDKPKTSNEYISCKEGFDWTTFDVKDGCGPVKGHYINKPSNQSHVKYGVSVETSNFSAGLQWENLRFQKDKVPEEPVYSVSAEGTSLKILVHYKDYHLSAGGKPDNHSVRYRECEGGSECEADNDYSGNETFPAYFLEPVYTINGLKPGTRYIVQVASLNELGISDYGDSVMVKLSSDVKVDVAGIVSGTLVVVLLLAGSLVGCLGRRQYKRCKQEAEITIPDDGEASFMLKNESIKDIQETKVTGDHDSGTGSGSPDLDKSSYIRLENGGIERVPDIASCSSFTSSTNSSGIFNDSNDSSVDTVKDDISPCINVNDILSQWRDKTVVNEGRAKSLNPTVNHSANLHDIDDCDTCIDGNSNTDTTDYHVALGQDLPTKRQNLDPNDTPYLPNNTDLEMSLLASYNLEQTIKHNLDYVETADGVGQFRSNVATAQENSQPSDTLAVEEDENDQMSTLKSDVFSDFSFSADENASAPTGFSLERPAGDYVLAM